MSGLAFKLTLAAVTCHKAVTLLQLRDSSALHPAPAVALSEQKHRLCSKRASSRNPGAGIDPSAPFEQVFKDGFMHVGCFKDELLYFGDKYGTHKHDYRMGEISNISIVRYELNVAKEDRKPMSTSVCFDFCRTIEDMSSFGIAHGRDCYCAPYFKQIAGDDSMCDNVCEGNAAQMCGGSSKSSIFQMHECADGADAFTAAYDAAEQAHIVLAQEITWLDQTADHMQDLADNYQADFSHAGDVAAADLMQQAKIVAGKLNESLAVATKVAEEVSAKLDESQQVSPNSTDHSAVYAAEALRREYVELTKTAADNSAHLEELRLEVAPEVTKDSPLYYKIMYFVDKKFENAPTTCSGTLLDKPIVDRTHDECGRICDKRGQECKGFSYFPDGLCFLMKKFKTVRYYTECEDDPQALHAFTNTSCSVRFSEYQGTDISPTSKTCKECLTEVEGVSGCRLK